MPLRGFGSVHPVSRARRRTASSLFLQTSDYWEYISDSVSGNAQPNCNASKLAQLDSIPPLVEQRRIAAKVEALLAQVNAARERLAKVPLMLKRFRQAVLAAACSGRLTAEWRESHAPARPADLAWSSAS